MSKTRSNVLLFPLTVLITGLSITSISQLPQSAESQQDYEELIITETNNEQKLNQKNIGSGSLSNLNCGTNVIECTSTATTCPTIPGQIPTPGTTVIPVVTQRVVDIQVIEEGRPLSGQAQCNPDEVVTGGGYDLSGVPQGPGDVFVLKEFVVNNGWQVDTTPASPTGTMRVFAECLKLVPS